MAGPHLLLDRVTAREHGRAVLDGLSLALPRGQTLALLGPAGAGKTATLLLLAGFLRPALGTVRLAGATSPWRRRSGATSRWCSSRTRCSRICRCSTMSASG
jgi:ABC-type multidrug transport system ATPase subunit